MKLLLICFTFITCVMSWVACDKDDPNPIPNPPDKPKYTQYGTPFANLPETEDIILYEVNLRAFSPSGDIQGVIDRLDHIESLGVNVIWLMPIHPIGQINSVNSPYSVRNYKAVSAEYGTMQDLRALTDQAHARGIAVILDWVANHTAWDHPWITNKTWYTQDANGNIIHPAGTNWMDVADLNFTNQDMRTAMIDAMHFWIYEANIDGFRCDYADGVPFTFWKQAWTSLDTIQHRDFILFAEGDREDHFNAGFDLNFGWLFYGELKNVFNGQPVSRIINAHNNEYNNLPSGKHWVRFSTNHDESAWDATPISLFNGVNGALAASVATIFTGGVPLMYSSQEVGTAQTVPFFSNSTINWNANPLMLDAYQKMLTFYAGSDVAKQGALEVFPHNDVLCFRKTLADKELVVIANLRNATIAQFNVPVVMQQIQWRDVMSDAAFPLEPQISLAPYQFYILEK